MPRETLEGVGVGASADVLVIVDHTQHAGLPGGEVVLPLVARDLVDEGARATQWLNLRQDRGLRAKSSAGLGALDEGSPSLRPLFLCRLLGLQQVEP